MKKNKLTIRVIGYLKRCLAQGKEWVNKDDIYNLAIKNGYKHDDIITTIYELNEIPNIASRSRKKEDDYWIKEYKYIYMSDEYIKKYYEKLDWFNSL